MARFLWLWLMLMGGAAKSQHIFTITDASKKFDAKVVMVDCSNGRCLGSGYTKIIRKHTNEYLFTIHHKDLTLFYPSDSMLVEGRSVIVNKNNFLRFEDLNFDGHEDLVLVTDEKWDVHLYDSVRHNFYSNKALSKLLNEHVYRIRPDSSRGNKLVLYSNNGVYDSRKEYVWVNGNPEMVYSILVWKKTMGQAQSKLRPSDLKDLDTRERMAAIRADLREQQRRLQTLLIVKVKEWKNGRRHTETRRYKKSDYEQLKDPNWKL